MQNSKKWLWGVIVVVALVLIYSLLGGNGIGILGSVNNLDLRGGGITQGQFTCGATSSVALAGLSGRSWVRFQNTTGTTINFMLASTTAASEVAYIGRGIQLDPVGALPLNATTGTFSGRTYWDSNESGVNWPHIFNCVASASNSVVSYIQAN